MTDASSWEAKQAPVADYKRSPKPVPEAVSAPAPLDPKLGEPILTVPDAKLPDTEVNAAPAPLDEAKVYSDGSSATGVAPLPDLSPGQQDARKPSAEDLDAVAEEEQAKADTAAG